MGVVSRGSTRLAERDHLMVWSQRGLRPRGSVRESEEDEAERALRQSGTVRQSGTAEAARAGRPSGTVRQSGG